MISCEQHDYIEIACTFRYRVKLVMKSGDSLEGVAIDTKYDLNKAECIKIEDQGTQRLVPLVDISRMEAMVENPHFRSVSFE